MPRKGITIDLAGQALDNDAFQPDPRPELVRILRDLADKIESGRVDEGCTRLLDYNGNRAGVVHIDYTGD